MISQGMFILYAVDSDGTRRSAGRAVSYDAAVDYIHLNNNTAKLLEFRNDPFNAAAKCLFVSQ